MEKEWTTLAVRVDVADRVRKKASKEGMKYKELASRLLEKALQAESAERMA